MVGKLNKSKWITLATIGSASALWGWVLADSPIENKPKPTNGAVIYNQRCVKCHGIGGKGVEDFTEDLSKITQRSGWQEIINNGKGSSMPGFKDSLSAQQLKAVLAHVRSFGTNKPKPSPTPNRVNDQPRTKS